MRKQDYIVGRHVAPTFLWVASVIVTAFSVETKTQTALTTPQSKFPSSPLSWTLEELAEKLGGLGRAKACWTCFRLGVDPVWYYSRASNNHCGDHFSSDNDDDIEPLGSFSSGALPADHNLFGWKRQQIQSHLNKMVSSTSPPVLGNKTLQILRSLLDDGIESSVASLLNMTISSDGTTKLLLELNQDQMLIETVIIPWPDRGSSTLCVSSQVGCRQACTFCSTGRMGLRRNLTSTEILVQMYWAKKICRLQNIHSIDNCVFMGMGEPGDNVLAVIPAAKSMVDRNLFQLTPRRVTISTVAPNPQVFSQLVEAPVLLAWSVHSSRDEIRKQLVPTTTHTMADLRQGLIASMQKRPKRLRNVMLEVTLLDEINDSIDDATHLSEFCRPILEEIQRIKLVVNLIPWNDIAATFGPASTYRRPTAKSVLAYQKVLLDKGILSYIRTTRGDEERAACGMLSTKNQKVKGVLKNT